MGANTSQVSDLCENQSLRTLIGTESISENDPFWNQLISFTFISPTSSGDSKLLEEAVIPLAKILIENNPRTGNFGALVRIFLGRTKELKISTECQDQLFIWQAHNALFMIRCLLKVFISEMTEEELHQQFSYQERAPGSCDTGREDLLEELMCNLVHLVVEVPLLDITYSILFEAVTTMLVLLSYQLFHKEILRDGLIYQYLMKERCVSLTSRLVKTLLYNFIRQEKCPPPATHIFDQQSDGGGLLYGLASGVASGLWSVFTLGGASSKPGLEQEQNPLPLSNQSLLLLLVLANLTDGPNDCPNPYRQAVTCFKNTQDTSSIPTEQHHTFQINFNSLYTALCEQQRSDQATLLLYTLLHQNTNMRNYMLSRTDMENLVVPILEILYHVEDRNSHHVYMALIILLILTEDDTFNRSIHEVVLKNITWYSERQLTEISLGSLLILVVIRTIQYNMTRTRDKYLHTNCLAALANMSAQFRCLHQYAAQRIISLFALLSKKHNKVLEQATQSLRGPRGADDSSVLPDYAQDLNVIEEVIRMMLEIINSCLSNSLHHNPNLVYALLYKRELFEQFRTHPSFQDIMQNLDTVIGFFSQRLEAAGTDLSVERVQEVIMKGAQALPNDRLKKFPELKFKYVEEDQPEDFFIPYVWSLVFNSGVGLHWSTTNIQLFSMDSA
ncbi:dymeclin [Oncorhynchus tshawytscha]|uniref:Dymeclin n=2 Tax=Oncorhynchus TaxID=8016 RepID=A0A8C7IW08_ONCKI|nr:dymeclin [Oncorhynchus kisutch]XP_031682017.1 dymeclin [Oncorhynchus kisutch]XP_031682018.1 dymeclin [Oncorhynchus kisutch]XP_031682019.1 dymeclin [Oncorhynchus kisutch]XP_042182437.1 dymeclin [Oncorhynchus tshawytscha]XP_042182438.1 dymeclin [Oncorhynchus tshawytscha]XP_042182439.1 dymeclin [Oncorhynchus tshawytscha]XP_042182440.1 dymeclin [Oncorhynchus tshawytscha]XP_046161039.1 dymeclin [Oncorhynchus gorbuscha]XP_046161040.1 dymeclin [Oncorhynchus gorbuscha]XP_046161041.1 dymeclin [